MFNNGYIFSDVVKSLVIMRLETINQQNALSLTKQLSVKFKLLHCRVPYGTGDPLNTRECGKRRRLPKQRRKYTA